MYRVLKFIWQSLTNAMADEYEETITERQKRILAIIIRDYIENAQPVGSQRLVEAYGVDASPATVRNEMAFLTQKGYLKQPHTSAGRVPTEKGFRFFVRHLMGQVDLPLSVQRTITHQFHQTRPDLDTPRRLCISQSISISCSGNIPSSASITV